MSILNSDQNQVLTRMTDEIIRDHIIQYGEAEILARYQIWGVNITKVDKDDRGWYIESKGRLSIICVDERTKSLCDHCLYVGQPIDKQKGFLIEDIGVYVRWHKHVGGVTIWDMPKLESTEGLPEELDKLIVFGNKSKKLTVTNKINVILIKDIRGLKILGDGCKNVLLDPDLHNEIDVTAPTGTKLYLPSNGAEYLDLSKKLAEF